MAKSGLAKKIEQELTCAVCLEKFRDPRILRCLHTYCRECIESLAVKNHEEGYIQCPACRERQTLPDAPDVRGKVAKLPVNFSVKNLVDLLGCDIEDEGLRCGNGLDENPAALWCVNCRIYLCRECETVHSKQVATRRHKTMSLDEVKRNGGSIIAQAHYCGEHPKEELALYCNTCRSTVCRDCVLVSHAKHSYMFVKDMSAQFITQLESAVRALQAKETEFKSSLAYITKVESRLMENYSKCQGSITSVFDGYIEKAKECRKVLLDELRTSHHHEVKCVAIEKEKVEPILTRLSNDIVACKRLLQSGDDIERAIMSTSISEKVKCLSTEVWSKENLKVSSWKMVDEDIDKFLGIHKIVISSVSALSFKLDAGDPLVGWNQFHMTASGDISDKTVAFPLAVRITLVPSEGGSTEIVPSKEVVNTGPCQWRCDYFLKNRGCCTIRASLGGEDIVGSPASFDVQKISVNTFVRRGQDWKWGMQDTGCGKVIADRHDGWISVEWANKVTNTYRWGAEGVYDVTPVPDENM